MTTLNSVFIIAATSTASTLIPHPCCPEMSRNLGRQPMLPSRRTAMWEDISFTLSPRTFVIYFRPNESELEEMHSLFATPKQPNTFASITGFFCHWWGGLNRRLQGQVRMRTLHKVPTHRVGTKRPLGVLPSSVS